MSQETGTERVREMIVSHVLPCLHPCSVRSCLQGSQTHTHPVLSASIALVQLTFLFIICFYILATWQGSASRFATHKLHDSKLLKIQKCQKFRTLGGERNGGMAYRA